MNEQKTFLLQAVKEAILQFKKQSQTLRQVSVAVGYYSFLASSTDVPRGIEIIPAKPVLKHVLNLPDLSFFCHKADTASSKPGSLLPSHQVLNMYSSVTYIL